MKILLVAEEAAGVQTLRTVAQTGHQVVGVMTAAVDEPDRPPGVRDAAAELGYAVWPAKWVKDAGFAARVQQEEVDLLLNVHSLYVIHEWVLAAPRFGSYNMHPGPLPQYAGLNAVSWALYYGETRHAVTIHRIVPKVDAGPIAYQSWFDVEEQDTALTVSVKCVKAGVPLIARILETAATNPAAIPTISQDGSRRRYYGTAVPQGGRLVWSRLARGIVNFVRACDYLPFRSPWGHPTGRVGGREISIVKATRTQEPCGAAPGTVGQVVNHAVKVAAADEWVLVHRLMQAGQCVDAVDLLSPGLRFEEEEGGSEG